MVYQRGGGGAYGWRRRSFRRARAPAFQVGSAFLPFLLFLPFLSEPWAGWSRAGGNLTRKLPGMTGKGGAAGGSGGLFSGAGGVGSCRNFRGRPAARKSSSPYAVKDKPA